jgi:hypothetical protein
MKIQNVRTCLILVLTAIACQPQPQIEIQATPLGESQAEQGGVVAYSHEDLVKEFYQMWIDYANQTGNPLVDELYKTGDYLTENGIARLEANKTADGWMADPVMCAQDVPQSVEVEASSVDGERANVRMLTAWGTRLGIDLVQVKGIWKIEAITCLGR